MNKKGFTLIELLAIIVILAIIAVITVPIILNIIEDSSKKAAIDSAYGYKEAVDTFQAQKTLQDENYVIPSGTYYVNGDTGYLQGTEETLNIAISGEMPSSGKIKISSKGKVEEAKLCINNYMVSYSDKHDTTVVKGCTPVEPGLYDANDNLVASYDDIVSEHGFDPSIDVSSSSRIGRDLLANYSNGVKLILPDTITRIGNNIFYTASTLEAIEIPSSVTSIGENALSNTKITSITIPSSVTSIESSAFLGCNKLNKVIFEDGSNLTSLGRTVFSNTNLTSITIPSSITEIGYNAFIGTKILYYTGNAVDTSNNNWGALSINPYIEGDFVYSDNTKTKLEVYLGTASSITIPSGVTTIDEKAFFNNKNLTSITIPSSVTNIGYMSFYSCSNLTSINFEYNSQLTNIDYYAFFGTGASSITIPSSVTNIGVYAFYAIDTVYYSGNAEDTYNNNWGANSIVRN